MTSARQKMLSEFKRQAELVGNQQYLVKRGVIDYGAIDWVLYTRTWAIMMDEGSLFGVGGIGDNVGQMTFEVFAKIPDNNADPLLDDGLLDEIIEDIVTVIEATERAKGPNGDPLVFRIPRQSARFLESHDTQLRVQGVVATFEISY